MHTVCANDAEREKESMILGIMGALARVGRYPTSKLRTQLSRVLTHARPDFLTNQQDASEVMMQIFDDIIPDEIKIRYNILTVTRKRCAGNEQCGVCNYWENVI